MNRTAPNRLDHAAPRASDGHERQLRRQFKLALFVVVVLAAATLGMMMSFTPAGDAAQGAPQSAASTDAPLAG